MPAASCRPDHAPHLRPYLEEGVWQAQHPPGEVPEGRQAQGPEDRRSRNNRVQRDHLEDEARKGGEPERANRDEGPDETEALCWGRGEDAPHTDATGPGRRELA